MKNNRIVIFNLMLLVRRLFNFHCRFVNIVFTLQFGSLCFSFRTSIIRYKFNYFTRFVLLKRKCNYDKFHTTINRCDRDGCRIIFNNKFAKICLFYRYTFSPIQKLNTGEIGMSQVQGQKYSKTRSSEVVKNNFIIKRYYSTEKEKEKSKSYDNINADAARETEKVTVDAQNDQMISVNDAIVIFLTVFVNHKIFGVKFPYSWILLQLISAIFFFVSGFYLFGLSASAAFLWAIELICLNVLTIAWMLMGFTSILCFLSASAGVIEASQEAIRSLKETYKKCSLKK
jgi:hypothetical protein